MAEGTRFSRHYPVTIVTRGSAENPLDSRAELSWVPKWYLRKHIMLNQTESYMSARKALTHSRAFCFLASELRLINKGKGTAERRLSKSSKSGAAWQGKGISSRR